MISFNYFRKKMSKFFMITPIFHDNLPLNESDTSCYDQKQMKKIFDSLWCMCVDSDWQHLLSRCAQFH